MEPRPAIKTVAEIALQSLVADFSANPLSLIAEYHSKFVIASALLTKGMAIVEGRPGARGDGFRLTLKNRELVVDDSRLPTLVGGSTDLRVLPSNGQEADPLFIELKTRFAFGSQASASPLKIERDIERVRNRFADLFILSASASIYSTLSSKHFFLQVPTIQPIGFEQTGWRRAFAGDCTALLLTASAFGHTGAFLALARSATD